MLRIAGLYDIDLATEMAVKFIKSTEYANYLDLERTKQFVQELILGDNSQKIVLMYEDKGAIAGMTVPHFFGNMLVATELAWWVEPEHRKSNVGKELLDAFEFWAKRVGCSLIAMTCLDDQLGKYYESRGFKLTEHAYIKEI